MIYQNLYLFNKIKRKGLEVKHEENIVEFMYLLFAWMISHAFHIKTLTIHTLPLKTKS